MGSDIQVLLKSICKVIPNLRDTTRHTGVLSALKLVRLVRWCVCVCVCVPVFVYVCVRRVFRASKRNARAGNRTCIIKSPGRSSPFASYHDSLCEFDVTETRPMEISAIYHRCEPPIHRDLRIERREQFWKFRSCFLLL